MFGGDGGGVMAVVMVVEGRGLPGSSSHRKGTVAEDWSGGVSIPECSGDCRGGGMVKKSGSFGVELASSSLFSSSALDPISLSLSLSCSLYKYRITYTSS